MVFRSGLIVPMLVVLLLIPGCRTSPDTADADSTVAAPEPVETTEATPPVKDPATEARLERIRRALEQGLDVNKTDPDGRTALMIAAFDGYTEVVALLLDYGAEVDRSDGAGRTAMMYASSGPFPQTVELLLRRGADVNHGDTAEGWTALMLAAAEGHQLVVEVLLRHGADIELTDQDGDAAIDHARERRQTHIVALMTRAL